MSELSAEKSYSSEETMQRRAQTMPPEMTLPSENESQSFRTGCKCLISKDFGAERLGTTGKFVPLTLEPARASITFTSGLE